VKPEELLQELVTHPGWAVAEEALRQKIEAERDLLEGFTGATPDETLSQLSFSRGALSLLRALTDKRPEVVQFLTPERKQGES